MTDERSNLPDTLPDKAPEVVHRTLEIPVAEFEGEYVRVMLGKIPAINLEMEVGYARGTHLKLELEVRCRSVRVDEYERGPHKGELYREHLFAIEEARVLGAYAAEDLDPGVGGGLAGPDPDDVELPFDDEQEMETDDRPEGEDDGDDRRAEGRAGEPGAGAGVGPGRAGSGGHGEGDFPEF